MRKGLLYIHGQGGTAQEAEHYKPLFPDCDVTGLAYQSRTPWAARDEFPRLFDAFGAEHDRVAIVANSIGAFFAMHALGGRRIERAYFISPIVDMGRLIADMLQWAGVTERALMERGTIETGFGETLSWEYLEWVRKHPVSWDVPTSILYGGKDNLQSPDTIRAFADRTGADVTVMENGEHWFHTPEQMAFLDNWMNQTARGIL